MSEQKKGDLLFIMTKKLVGYVPLDFSADFETYLFAKFKPQLM